MKLQEKIADRYLNAQAKRLPYKSSAGGKVFIQCLITEITNAWTFGAEISGEISYSILGKEIEETVRFRGVEIKTNTAGGQWGLGMKTTKDPLANKFLDYMLKSQSLNSEISAYVKEHGSE